MEHCFIEVIVIVISLTDPSLTHSNVATVVSSVSVDGLGNCLFLPPSVMDQIKTDVDEEEQRRDQYIHYWMSCSPYATWPWLAETLHEEGESSALRAANRFFQRAPGGCGMFTCIILRCVIIIMMQ